MDKETLSDIMYAVGMESQEAWHHMKTLCDAMGIDYPPKRKDEDEDAAINRAEWLHEVSERKIMDMQDQRAEMGMKE